MSCLAYSDLRHQVDAISVLSRQVVAVVVGMAERKRAATDHSAVSDRRVEWTLSIVHRKWLYRAGVRMLEQLELPNAH